jgi:hypothetical protein
MTNIYVSWNFLKEKVAAGKTLYYHLNDWNLQLYILDGTDAYIHYTPLPDKFNQMVIDDENKTQSENDYNDFNTNYKPSAVETEGVKD